MILPPPNIRIDRHVIPTQNRTPVFFRLSKHFTHKGTDGVFELGKSRSIPLNLVGLPIIPWWHFFFSLTRPATFKTSNSITLWTLKPCFQSLIHLLLQLVCYACENYHEILTLSCLVFSFSFWVVAWAGRRSYDGVWQPWRLFLIVVLSHWKKTVGYRSIGIDFSVMMKHPSLFLLPMSYRLGWRKQVIQSVEKPYSLEWGSDDPEKKGGERRTCFWYRTLVILAFQTPLPSTGGDI